MSSKEFTVTFLGGVADVMTEASKMIHEAKQWAAGFQWAEDTGFTAESQAKFSDEWRNRYQKMQDRVDEMELSWLRSLVHLIQLASNSYDGDLRLSWDSPDSLFFHHPKSGYHGGLIFHPDYADGRKRLPVGTRSIHT
jgi:hypothetical protein